MRDFIGAIDNQEANDRSVFITTSKFTPRRRKTTPANFPHTRGDGPQTLS